MMPEGLHIWKGFNQNHISANQNIHTHTVPGALSLGGLYDLEGGSYLIWGRGALLGGIFFFEKND